MISALKCGVVWDEYLLRQKWQIDQCLIGVSLWGVLQFNIWNSVFLVLPFTNNKIKRMDSWSGSNKVWNIGSQTEFIWSLDSLYSNTFSLTIWICGLLSTVVNEIQSIFKALIRLLKGLIIWICKLYYFIAAHFFPF